MFIPPEFSTHPSFWSEELESEFATIAMLRYPNEAVCLVMEDGLHELVNVSTDGKIEFTVHPTPEQLESMLGIIHSHPDSDIRPSEEDCKLQISLDKPCGIMPVTDDSQGTSFWSGDHLLDKPLEGRPFVHVYYDCYSLVRAYYHQKLNVLINDYARQDDWWVLGKDLYDSQFEDAGFTEINTNDGIVTGDVILMKINSPVVNHAAVYIGGDDILHHIFGRLSRLDKLSTWAKLIDKVVRLN